jgi:hypothetical protein
LGYNATQYSASIYIVLTENTSTSILSTILNSEFLRWFLTELIQFWRSSQFKGVYKVESHHATLELLDEQGQRAIYSKRQKVTFLQDGVFAIQDQAWGDGDIFADYRCSPGIAVDRHIESYRWKILISLRATKNRGDTEEFIMERTIRNGFTTSTEHFQSQIDHPTKQLTLSVIFPRQRLPKTVFVMEQNVKRSFALSKEYGIPLSQGRVQYQWEVEKPRLYEAYILRWEW